MEMLYYHLRIFHKPDSSKKSVETTEIDLSDTELVEFVRMYEQGQTFLCGGRSVNPHRISLLKIYRTQKKAQEVAQDVFTKYNTAWDYIFDAGEVVTRQFVKRPPSRIETPSISKKKISKMPSSKNIFIVHGRDHKPMKELKEMLYDFGLNPIILHEKESEGSLTLAEKLEEYSEDVGYAFAILTPDDVGCQKNEVEEMKSDLVTQVQKEKRLIGAQQFKEIFQIFSSRARQNVIFEMGYFWGLLKRKRVCCLLKGDVEKPSDIKGVVYIPFKDSIQDVEVKMMKKLTRAGYEVKM